jgi:hypothetical protein
MDQNRRIRLGLYGMLVGLVFGWIAWFLSLNNADRVAPFILVMIFAGGTGAFLAVRPVLGVMILRRESRFDPNLAGRGLLIIVMLAALVTASGLFVVHSIVPILAGDGVASIAPDGRFVLVNRGQVLRELTVGEYERLRASGAASLATVGNLLLLFFLLAVVTSLAFLRRRPSTGLRRPVRL